MTITIILILVGMFVAWLYLRKHKQPDDFDTSFLEETYRYDEAVLRESIKEEE